jgi:hypothetical protein
VFDFDFDVVFDFDFDVVFNFDFEVVFDFDFEVVFDFVGVGEALVLVMRVGCLDFIFSLVVEYVFDLDLLRRVYFVKPPPVCVPVPVPICGGDDNGYGFILCLQYIK